MFYYPMSDFATTFALYADAVKGCVRYKCYSSIPRFAVHSPRGCVGRFAEGSAKVSDADQPLSLMVLPSCPKCGKELAAGTEFCVFCGASTKPDFSSPNAPKSQKGRSIAIAVVLIIIVLTAVGFMVGRNMPPQATVTVTTSVSDYATTTQKLTVQASSTQTTGQGEWKTIKTFTGSADKSTEDFNVPTNSWRIVYATKAESEQYAAFYALFGFPFHRLPRL